MKNKEVAKDTVGQRLRRAKLVLYKRALQLREELEAKVTRDAEGYVTIKE